VANQRPGPFSLPARRPGTCTCEACAPQKQCTRGSRVRAWKGRSPRRWPPADAPRRSARQSEGSEPSGAIAAQHPSRTDSPPACSGRLPVAGRESPGPRRTAAVLAASLRGLAAALAPERWRLPQRTRQTFLCATSQATSSPESVPSREGIPPSGRSGKGWPRKFAPGHNQSPDCRPQAEVSPGRPAPPQIRRETASLRRPDLERESWLSRPLSAHRTPAKPHSPRPPGRPLTGPAARPAHARAESSTGTERSQGTRRRQRSLSPHPPTGPVAGAPARESRTDRRASCCVLITALAPPQNAVAAHCPAKRASARRTSVTH